MGDDPHPDDVQRVRDGEIEVIPPNALASVESRIKEYDTGLVRYLEFHRLPTEKVLVSLPERGRLLANVPAAIEKLDPDRLPSAMYLSKFIAASGTGLFDAALNYLWDAVVSNLRERIVRFDLDYFYDVAIKDTDERGKFRTPEDLQNLGDWDLIKGCREVGLITDIGYKHLDYVRDMRNWVSAAHPNQADITGLNLASWLETCIVHVLSAPLDSPHFELKRLLTNIKKEKLSKSDAEPIRLTISRLPQDMVHSLLQALFGIYVDPDTSVGVRQNVDFIASAVWERSDEGPRRDLGVRYAKLTVNADVARKGFARGFLEKVGGLSYLTEDMLAVEFSEATDNLRRAHYAYYNFYNEEPLARALLRLVPKTGAVPKAVVQEYVRTLVICRLGNSYGISRFALPFYEKMIGMFRDQESREFVRSLADRDVANALEGRRLETFKGVARDLEGRGTDLVLRRALSRIAGGSPKEFTDGVIARETASMLGTT